MLTDIANDETGAFFTFALTAIVEARRSIVWSYPYGYFIVHATKRNFYEQFQSNLEHCLENTAKIIEVTPFESFRETLYTTHSKGKFILTKAFFNYK